MDLGRSIKRAFFAALWPVVLMGVTVYFGWYGLYGAHGQKALPQRQAALVKAQSDLDQATTERANWQQRVASLKSDQLDPDMLDQQSRAVLNLAQPDEIVVPYPKDQAGR